jgi:hypothetical protein
LFDHADWWKAALQWLLALPTKCRAADGARLVNCDSSESSDDGDKESYYPLVPLTQGTCLF